MKETYSATADEEEKQKKEFSEDVEIESKDSIEDQGKSKAEVNVKAIELVKITVSEEEDKDVLEGKELKENSTAIIENDNENIDEIPHINIMITSEDVPEDEIKIVTDHKTSIIKKEVSDSNAEIKSSDISEESHSEKEKKMKLETALGSVVEYVKMSSVHEKMVSINENSSYTNFEKLPLEGNAQNLKLWEEESIQKHAENDSLTVDSSSNITSISNLEESTPSNSNTEETTLDDVQIKYIKYNYTLECKIELLVEE